jgi:hypothetical protein
MFVGVWCALMTVAMVNAAFFCELKGTCGGAGICDAHLLMPCVVCCALTFCQVPTCLNVSHARTRICMHAHTQVEGYGGARAGEGGAKTIKVIFEEVPPCCLSVSVLYV